MPSNTEHGFAEVSAPFIHAEKAPAEIALADVKAVFSTFWKPGFGSIAADEAMFIQDFIRREKPDHFLEVGMASGLSGGLIARFLEASGGSKFTTLDHDNSFFGDPSKENGFLIGDVYTGSQIEIVKRPFTTALDLDDVGERFDMAFIDANHQHPWPLIDTLCVYPHMNGRRVIIHHDLRLFRKQDLVFGIGPKYLFDQFPDSLKLRSKANEGNIFALILDMSQSRLEEIAADAFSLPWSLRTPLQEKYIEQTRGMLSRHYSAELLAVFDKSLAKFNVMDRFRSGL
jgi:hypothetical protein